MYQHEQRRPSNTGELHVLVHSGLKAHFNSPNSQLHPIRSGLGRVDFVDDADLAAPGEPLDLPVLIPVTSEFQAEGLRAVRVRHPMTLLVAVTNDVSGMRTYYAIRSGADFVFNMAIPGESQVDMLFAQLRSHSTAAPPETGSDLFPEAPADQGALHVRRHEEHGRPDSLPRHGGRPAPSRGIPREARTSQPGATTGRQTLRAGAAPRAGTPPPAGTAPLSGNGQHGPVSAPASGPGSEEHAPAGDGEFARADAHETDTGLMRLLCSSMTVSEIARRYYCSERTMYRRIRKLYDDLGVRSRAELIPLASVLSLNQPRPAHLPQQRDRRTAC